MRYNELLQESAARELAEKLPTLRKHDYNSIDKLMQHVSARHKITGKKLHDLFVHKYGHTPDVWIKKLKNKLGEESINEFASYDHNDSEDDGDNEERLQELYNQKFYLESIVIDSPESVDPEELEGLQQELDMINDEIEQLGGLAEGSIEKTATGLKHHGDFPDYPSRQGQQFQTDTDRLDKSLTGRLDKAFDVHWNPINKRKEISADPSRVEEDWSEKYKRSIDCRHPKGFSQKAHCAGKKKHNESIEMEMVCPDCGMCETHSDHENLDEACWKGYHKEGMKTMFGKRYPNCVKNEGVAEESCPHCNGPMFSEMMINEKKDACYYKVKSRYKVWPSAYASGALVKCRKKGANNWGNSTKNESVIEKSVKELEENLHQWFKEKWVRFGPDGKIRGACARGDDSEGKPKCLPQSKAQNLGKKGRASAAARKRREDPNPERHGKAINVNTKKKTNESVDSSDDIQKIKDFINWSIKQLHIQKPYPKITLSRNTKVAQQGHHTGVHTEDNKIWVYIENRNLIDIFRTIFHELVHERQSQLNMIKDGDSYPGSPIEAMADMVAGKYIKIYGKDHPEIFQ